MRDDLPRLLGVLRYPGFEYLAIPGDIANPAEVVLRALVMTSLPARVAEALPWVLVTHVDLDWAWLLSNVELSEMQNRLGFFVGLATQLAERRDQPAKVARLTSVERQLEVIRLGTDDTLGQNLSEVECRHSQQHRSALAARWNLLTNLRAEDLRYW